MDGQIIPITEILEQLPKGLAVMVSLLLIFLGYRRSTAPDPKPKEQVIAGAIVDNAAIFKLASSIDQHNTLVSQTHRHLEDIVDAFNRHSEEVKNLTKEIRDSITAILRSKH